MTYFPGILSNGALVPGLAAATVRTSLGLGTADSPTFLQAFLTRPSVGSGFSLDITTPDSADTGIRIRPQNLSQSLTLQWGDIRSSGALLIGTQSGSLRFFSAATLRWDINASGHFLPAANNAYDIGSVTNRVRNGFFTGLIEVTKTFTSATSNERFCIDALSDAANHRLVVARGSLGGAERGLQIGAMQDGQAFVPWLSLNAQLLETYNAYTNSSNHESAFMSWNSNVLEIGTKALGSGTRRNLNLRSTWLLSLSSFDTVRMTFNTGNIACHNPITPLTAATQDLGTSLNPWRNIFLRPSSSLEPQSNGDTCIEFTNNTTLTLKAKGSDGVIRSGTVTLA